VAADSSAAFFVVETLECGNSPGRVSSCACTGTLEHLSLANDASLCLVGAMAGSKMKPKIKEHICEACNGTGFPVVMQPVKPGRKIYPVQCRSCGGKGKITDAD